MTAPTEQWRAVPGHKSQYYVSSLGRILNVKSQVLLTPFIHKSRAGRYLRVKLGTKNYMVHTLVAEVYPDLVPRPHLDCTQIDHIDRNTLNPATSNLRWVTQSENVSAGVYGRRIKIGKDTISARRSK